MNISTNLSPWIHWTPGIPANMKSLAMSSALKKKNKKKNVTIINNNLVQRALWLTDLAARILKDGPFDYVVCFPAQVNFQEI